MEKEKGYRLTKSSYGGEGLVFGGRNEIFLAFKRLLRKRKA